MGTRLRSILVVAIILVVVIAFVFAAYRFGWSGTGFLNKSLWDWLQLLIIPLALAVIALVFQLANARTERQIAKQRYEQDQQIALDKQRQDLLQTYLDRMSELLLKEKLRSSEVDAEVRNVARARTLTVLPLLDADRKLSLLLFLYEAHLLEVIRLDDSNLSGITLHDFFLSNLKLRSANLAHIILHNSKLDHCSLVSCNMSHAIFQNSDLDQFDLNHSDMSYSALSKGSLTRSELSYVNLKHTTMAYMDLSHSSLIGADFNYAKLIHVDLSGADLSGANLRDATITSEQLAKAKSLQGATMPDGSIHP